MLAFLQTLLPVAAAANAVARQALSQMRQAADEVQQRWDVQQREMEQHDAGGVSASATEEEITRFFDRRRQQKEQQEAEGHPLEAMERGAAALLAIALAAGGQHRHSRTHQLASPLRLLLLLAHQSSPILPSRRHALQRRRSRRCR